jgi:hypothetical protein
MKRLMLICAMLVVAGCGDPNYVEPLTSAQMHANAQKCLDISIGLIVPTDDDLKTLDISPAKPDGVIDMADALVWLQISEK